MIYPRFAHTNWNRPTDPINLVFRNIELREIEDFLLDRGWRDPGYLSSDQFVPFPSAVSPTKQDLELIFGTLVGRYHIRLWDISKFLEPFMKLRSLKWNLNSKVIGSVHWDALKLNPFKKFGHVAADFESIENDFANLCRQNRLWDVFDNEIALGNYFAGYEDASNDGMATLIQR
jgi:hypothetical protein